MKHYVTLFFFLALLGGPRAAVPTEAQKNSVAGTDSGEKRVCHSNNCPILGAQRIMLY